MMCELYLEKKNKYIFYIHASFLLVNWTKKTNNEMKYTENTHYDSLISTKSTFVQVKFI
jgi:glycerol-3-phosphate responsive antiterminator